MISPVGYLTNQMDGLHGSRGEYYDYLLGKNGLFIEARSPLLSVRVPVAAALGPRAGRRG